MSDLTGKVALITGAARGQGRSHAVRLAGLGAEIIALDICSQVETVAYPMSTPADLDETTRLVEKLDRRIVASQADVRDRDRMQEVVDQGLAEFGHIDIVVANAGIMPIIPPGAQEFSAWQDAIDIMLTGVYNTIAATTPAMVERGEGGSVVITSSTAGLIGSARGQEGVNTPGFVGYTAAKHGVVGLMRVYANMLAPHSIRVNTVHPTGVNTPMVMNEEFGAYMEKYPFLGEAMQNALPVAVVEPIDISNAIAFLCSDEARYITGTTLPVDAGFINRR